MDKSIRGVIHLGKRGDNNTNAVLCLLYRVALDLSEKSNTSSGHRWHINMNGGSKLNM